ncbi:MAG TPA: (d)CMP kinase [Phototrophicaceae bacterium]|jgi:cytidylate kinase|nr:(d)CMP kinase [Phototrophicaceae bacterium]
MYDVKRIAIDGPAASGKSTIGAKLAQHLGYLFVDTGILYRSITHYFLSRCPEIDLHSETAVSGRVQSIHIHVVGGGDEPLVILLDGAPVEQDLHTEVINRAVPVVAAYPAVRTVVRKLQAQIAAMEGIIIAGRDIGTVVLPDADLKLFLEVSLEERAERRYLNLLPNNPNITLQQIIDDLRRRDGLDTTRTESPLRAADDSVVIVTDGIGIDGVMEEVLRHVTKEKQNGHNNSFV